MVWLIIVTLIVLYIHYNWTRRHLIVAARKYKGPIPLPLVGNGLQFCCKNEDILQRINSMVLSYSEPVRFWLGPKLLLIFMQPSQIEKILASPKFSHKHEVYEFIKEFLGDGLISSSGSTHKTNRRMLQPFFAMSLIVDSLPIIQKHVTVCMEKLEEMVDRETFNIEPYVHKCFTDAVEEILYGNRNKCQEREFNEFEKAFASLYNHGFTRLVKFWLHPDIIYKNMPLYKRSQEINHILKQKSHRVLCESWNRRKDLTLKGTDFVPLVDQIADFIEENPGYCNSKTFEDHILTFYGASEDTLTIISCYTAVCLGMYKEYQSKAAKEIKNIFGTTPRNVTFDDIKQATYIEMCSKDAMRLFPIAPYIIRQSSENVELDGYTIPEGSAVVIPIFNVHRDEKFWQNPHHFYPDHFLPDNAKGRPVCSFIPFSMGSRGCIGKLFAQQGLKLFMCNLLQRFEIEADGKVPDLELRMDISVRPKNGYNVRLKKRIWN